MQRILALAFALTLIAGAAQAITLTNATVASDRRAHSDSASPNLYNKQHAAVPHCKTGKPCGHEFRGHDRRR